ncbi:unnamed protein product [Caenorhabditis angaria]|uniref:Uncharacterized protein n=1 Tax=Caenorhabditis angaria TaxID=860376 RepID=A0A9P1N3U3_9PELO|nr:unnamed protein product [Caenorhabditis angaria]
MYSSTFIIFLSILIKCSLQESQILKYEIVVTLDAPTIENFQLLDANLKVVKNLPLQKSIVSYSGEFDVNSTTVDEMYRFKVLSESKKSYQYVTFTRHPGREDSLIQVLDAKDQIVILIETKNVGSLLNDREDNWQFPVKKIVRHFTEYIF